jgi:hypothetical protein
MQSLRDGEPDATCGASNKRRLALCSAVHPCSKHRKDRSATARLSVQGTRGGCGALWAPRPHQAHHATVHTLQLSECAQTTILLLPSSPRHIGIPSQQLPVCRAGLAAAQPPLPCWHPRASSTHRNTPIFMWLRLRAWCLTPTGVAGVSQRGARWTLCWPHSALGDVDRSLYVEVCPAALSQCACAPCEARRSIDSSRRRAWHRCALVPQWTDRGLWLCCHVTRRQTC